MGSIENDLTAYNLINVSPTYSNAFVFVFI